MGEIPKYNEPPEVQEFNPGVLRSGGGPSIQEIRNLGFEPHLIPKLHCKLYLNEKRGIVTSMNMLLSSVSRAREIGYLTETEEERSELFEFFERYVEAYSTKSIEASPIKDWRKYLVDELGKALNGDVRIYDEDGSLVVQSPSNRFQFFINNSDGNKLRLMGILANKEFLQMQGMETEFGTQTNLNIELQEGGNGRYDLVWGEPDHNLVSPNFQNLALTDFNLVTQSILNFIQGVEKFKRTVAEKY